VADPPSIGEPPLHEDAGLRAEALPRPGRARASAPTASSSAARAFFVRSSTAPDMRVAGVPGGLK